MNRSLVRLILVGLSLIGLSTALGRNAETDSANESVLRAANTRSEQRQTEVRTCATKDVPETVADQIELSLERFKSLRVLFLSNAARRAFTKRAGTGIQGLILP
jgi:hypothetical protein